MAINHSYIVLHLSLFVVVFCGYRNLAEGTRSNKAIGERISIVRRSDRMKKECNLETDADGNLPLTKDNVHVEFYRQGHANYFARVTWNVVKVNNTFPTSFWILWKKLYGSGDCKIVKNKTSFDIKWNFNEELFLQVVPFPVRSKFKIDMLSFKPHYKELPTATHLTSTKAATRTSSHYNPTSFPYHPTDSKTNSTANKSPSAGEAFSSKIIIGCVTGVTVGTLLVVFLIMYYCKSNKSKKKAENPPPNNSGIYYVSFYNKDEKFARRVEDFVTWLRGNGFNVQMVTNLTRKYHLLLREMGRFRFGEKLVGTARNVFIMVSPSYLRLCRLDEQEDAEASLSQEERILYSEIVQIRSYLCANMYRSDRFIPILLDVREADLPYWMKELVLYSWPEEKSGEKLLYRLHNLPEYAPRNNNVEKV